MEENNKILIDVEVKATEALKQLAEMKMQLDELKQKRAEQVQALKNEGQATDENKERIAAISTKISEYDSKIKVATSAMNGFTREVKGNIQQQMEYTGSLNQMRARLSGLTGAYDNLTQAERNSAKGVEMKNQIASLTQEISQAEQGLGNFHRQVGNYELAGKSLRGELRQMTQQMAELRLKGEENSREYQNLVQKVGDFKKAMIGATKEMQNASDRNLKLNGAIQAVQGLTSAYALYNSVAGLVGAKNEELNKIAQKSMLLLTALNSLEQIRNMMLSTSKAQKLANIVLDKIGLTLTERQTRAEAAHTVMMNSSNIATKAVAAAQWLWNAALAANPLGAILAVIGLVVSGIILFTKVLGKNKEANDEQAQAEKRNAEVIKQRAENIKKYSEDIGQSVGGLRAKYEELRLKYVELGNDVKAKSKFIKENKEGFNELGVSVNNVTQADNLFIKNTQAFINSLNARAKAQANMNLAIQAYQKAAELANKPVEYKLETKYKTVITKNGNDTERVQVTDEEKTEANKTKALKENLQERDKLNKQAERYIKTAQQNIKQGNDDLANASIKAAQDTSKKVKNNAKSTAEKLKELQEATRENEQKNLELQYAEMTTDFLKKQEYEKAVFDLQQKYDKEDLEEKKKNKEITLKDYKTRLDSMDKSLKIFNQNQIKELEEDLKKRIAIEKKSDEELIKENERKKEEDVRIFEEEIRKRDGLNSNSELNKKQQDELNEYALARTMQEIEEEEKIKKESLDRRLKEVEDRLNKEYDRDLSKYTDNESKKLELSIEMQKELIAEKKKIQGADTGEDEAKLRTLELQQQTLLLNKELANEQLTAKQKYELKKAELEKELELYKGNADKEEEIYNKLKQADKEYNQERINNVMEWADQINNISNNINEFLKAREESELSDYETKNDKKKETLKERLKHGLITQKEYDKEVAKLDNDLDKKKAEIIRNQAKREKVLKIFEIATSTAAGIMKAFEQTGPIAGGVLAAIVAAMGALQTATVLTTPLPKASKGMLLNGRSHAQGGILIEAEGGEAVINKESTRLYTPLLSAINQAGGGVAFAKFQDGGYVARNGNSGSNDVVDRLDKLSQKMENLKIYVSVEDINREQKKYAKIQDRANY